MKPRRIMTVLSLLTLTAVLYSCMIDTGDNINVSSTFFTATFETTIAPTHEPANASIFAGRSESTHYALSLDQSGCQATLRSIAQTDRGEAMDCNIAIYPCNDRATCFDNAVSVELPLIQNYSADSADSNCRYMVAATGSTKDNKLNFKHICGLVRVNIKGTGNIASLTLSGNNNEKIAGQCTIGNALKEPSVKMYYISSQSLTLSCGNGVELNDQGVDFFFALPPTLFSKGLTLTITDSAGNSKQEVLTNQIVVERAKVTAIEELEYDPRKLESFVAQYSSTDFSADKRVYNISRHSVGNGINLIIMGDGFTDCDISDGTYDQTMRKAAKYFMAEEPICRLKDRFDVDYVTAVSENRTINNFSNTCFGCRFAGDNSTYVSGNDSVVLEYAKLIEEADLGRSIIVVVVNAQRYAGTCFLYYSGQSIAYVPLDSSDENFGRLINHEAVGHALGKLMDEYFYEQTITEQAKEEYRRGATYGWGANVDLTGDPKQIKWGDMVADSRYKTQTGIYQGALSYSKGAWRSSPTSIMMSNCGGFNAPSRRELYRRITLLSGMDYSSDKFAEFDATNLTADAIERQKAAAQRFDNEQFVPLHSPVVAQSPQRQ